MRANLPMHALPGTLRSLRCSFSWAWLDIKCRYRRSVIGPFWETINVLVLLTGMSLVSAAIFDSNPVTNLPFIGLGIITWSAIIGIMNEATNCFINNKELIKNSSLGIDIYTGRTVFRIFITTAHHLILYFIGLLLLPIPFGPVSLLSMVGWLLLFINALWIIPFFGLLCARFRDLEMIVRNVMQLAFYATPVFWDYHMLTGKRELIVDYNPLFYFLETIRAPLLGQIPPLYYYQILLGITLLGYVLLALVYVRMRKYLAFYL